jgi:hypothetical protein
MPIAFLELLQVAAAAQAAFLDPSSKAEELAATLEPVLETEFDEIAAAALVDTFVSAQQQALKPKPQPDALKVASLLSSQQVAQRTPAWYAESADLLTASELGNLFKSPRTRGLLVMSKVQPPTHTSSAAPVDSSFMTAFDWGIRFEPVVKMLYERRYKSVVAEVGRIRHPTLARCAASPDGVVHQGERAGRLLEIKCPVTRQPDDSVPDDYYAQMQQQLEVCDLEQCDYVEVKFRAPYSSPGPMEVAGPVAADMMGIIWRLERDREDGTPKGRYLYEEPGLLPDEPAADKLLEGEVVMERVVWEVITWNEITVHRNRAFWSATLPKIEEFWADVEKARRGEFVLPESKRTVKPKVVAPEKCLVVLSPKS